MLQTIKDQIQSVLRWMLRPLHHRYERRNGVTDVTNRQELPNEVLLGLASESLDKGHTVTIWVKGYSMRPFLEHERDRVLLAKQAELHVGDAVLAQIVPGHYVLHRIVQLNGNHVVLQGDGNVRGVEHCLRSDVCGTVMQYIRPQRTILATDPTLIRRIRLWRRLFPIRRWLLVFYRAVL